MKLIDGYKALDKVHAMQESADAFEGSSAPPLIRELSRVSETVATLAAEAEGSRFLNRKKMRQLEQGINRIDILMHKLRPRK